MGLLARWKKAARRLKLETWTLYFACRDPRTPWYAKAVAAAVAAYAFSPIDLIPDFIPVLGYLDDLVIVPLGIALALRLIPRPVYEDCRAHAEQRLDQRGPRGRIAAGIIIALWAGLAAFVAWRVIGAIGGR